MVSRIIFAIILLTFFLALHIFNDKKYREFIWIKNGTVSNDEKTRNLCEEFGYLSIYVKNIQLGDLISQYATLYSQARHYNASPIIPKSAKEELRYLFQHLSIPAYENPNCHAPFYCEINGYIL